MTSIPRAFIIAALALTAWAAAYGLILGLYVAVQTVAGG